MSEIPARKTDVWRWLWGRRTARAAIVLLAVVTVAAIFGPAVLPAHYAMVTADQYSPPTFKHPFGTDLHGRDLLFRVLQGAQISLLVGSAGALISLFMGTSYGMISGYLGGKWDSLMMRFVEILYSIPRLIIIMIGISAFDSHLANWLSRGSLHWLTDYSRIVILVLSLGLIEWLTMARIVRGQVLSLKSLQFVAAARSLGQTHAKIIMRHLLPNLVGIVVIYLTLTIPSVILDESFLSFLGLGVQAPLSSWGSLLSDGAQEINPVRSYWWLLVFPAIAMSSTLLALNFLGDALRDVLDPRERR